MPIYNILYITKAQPSKGISEGRWKGEVLADNRNDAMIMMRKQVKEDSNSIIKTFVSIRGR